MALPFFYLPFIDERGSLITLDEETSKHIIGVLRMTEREKIHLTDGKGHLLTAEITDPHKKMCVVRIIASESVPHAKKPITIALSLLKNGSRFEWFVEKAAELGVSEIIPMLCERSEKLHFRMERKKNILLSAMLQSQQTWMPVIHEPKKFTEIISTAEQEQKFIAHCIGYEKTNLADAINSSAASSLVLIGPEGDFTKEEVGLALQQHYIPVALGATRLRSETAAVVAAAILSIR